MNTQKWIGAVVVVVVLVAAAYFLGQNNNQTQTTNTSAVNNTSTQPTSVPTPQNANPSANNTASSTQNNAGVVLNTPADWASTPIANNVGDHWKKISLGANAITQDGITFSDTITNLGQSISPSDNLWGQYVWSNGLKGSPDVTTGDFVQVNLIMNNNTQSLASVEIALYYLADQAGRGFQWKADHSSCSNEADSINVPQQLEPGIPCAASILYEVSQQSQSFNLDFDMKNDQYNGNVPYGK